MATRTSILALLQLQLYATTSIKYKRLIVISVDVDGASRPLHALLDSITMNNFVRADILSNLSSRPRVREFPGSITVKYAEAKPRTKRQRSVVFPYRLDVFLSSDEFQVF